MVKKLILYSGFLCVTATATRAELTVKEKIVGLAVAEASTLAAMYALHPISTLCHELGHLLSDKLCYGGKTGYLHIGASPEEAMNKPVLYKNNWITVYKWPFVHRAFFDCPRNPEEQTRVKESIILVSGGLAGAVASMVAAMGAWRLAEKYRLTGIASDIWGGVSAACLTHMVIELTNWYPYKSNDGARMQDNLDPALRKYYKPAAVSAITGLSLLGIYMTLSARAREKLVLSGALLKNKLLGS